MISFFINLALFCIGVYCAILIAALALVFLGNLLVAFVAGLSAIVTTAWSVIRAVVLLDGIWLWIARALHVAFSVWVLIHYRSHDYDPADYEALAWLIVVGLVLFWFTPWTRELVVSIRRRLRSRRAAGRSGDRSGRNGRAPLLC
jgi:hypothetical protein